MTSLILDRRRLLGRALQVAAVGTMTTPSLPASAVVASSPPGLARVLWDTELRAWPRRPDVPASAVMFISTLDRTAPEPRDFDLLVGDVWWRHPCSMHVVEQRRDV